MLLSRSVWRMPIPITSLRSSPGFSGLPNVLQLQDHFSLQGPNGVHTVLVLNVLGDLRSVIRLSKGPRHNLVRKLCHDITCGLAALHRQGLVHGGMYQLARCYYPLT